MKRLLLAIIIACAPAYCAIAFDATGISAAYTSSGVNAWNHTCTGSNLILFVNLWSRTVPSAISSVTYNGVAMTLGVKNEAGNNYGYIYYLINPATGVHQVSATSTAELIGISVSYANAAQSSQPDNTGSATNASWDPPTLTMTVNTANSWIISMNTNAGFGAGSAGAGSLVQRLNFSAISPIGAVWDSNGPEATGSLTWNDGYIGSNQNQTIVGLSFKPFGSTYHQQAKALGFGH